MSLYLVILQQCRLFNGLVKILPQHLYTGDTLVFLSQLVAEILISSAVFIEQVCKLVSRQCRYLWKVCWNIFSCCWSWWFDLVTTGAWVTDEQFYHIRELDSTREWYTRDHQGHFVEQCYAHWTYQNISSQGLKNQNYSTFLDKYSK